MMTKTNEATLYEEYPELAQALGTESLFFKREDTHRYGSHKGRSIPHMIDHYLHASDRRFAITGSGNAALAAALYVQELNAGPHKSDLISLDIFIGQHAAKHKVEKIEELVDDQIHMFVKERPLQALTQATNEGVRSLRQSTDDVALEGYASLAAELAHDMHGKGAVFMATSSGTTAQALAQYFSLKKLPIQVHIIQTSACHPISQEFEPPRTEENTSIADAIVDHTAYRTKALIPLIHKTKGYGWTASNEDIELALDLTKKYAGIEISPNAALSVAGVMQAVYAGHDIDGPIVCVIGGE